MIERQRQFLFGRRTRGAVPPREGVHLLHDRTVPGIAAPPPLPDDERTILGFPVDEDAGEGTAVAVLDPWEQSAAPDIGVRLVVLPRADPLAGIALVLAGVAAAASLWLPWFGAAPDRGSALVVRGLSAVGSDLLGADRGHLWQPPAVVLGGALLLLLGVLLFLPSRTHRVVGVLALLVASAVTSGTLFLVADAQWDPARFDVGLWLATAVAGLGLLGALKAMLTVPRVTVQGARVAPR
jgi:hypothetical protein